MQQTIAATQAVFQSDLAQLGLLLARLVAQMDSSEAEALQALQAEVAAQTLTQPCWESVLAAVEKTRLEKSRQCEARKKEYEESRRVFLDALKTVKEKEAGEGGQQNVDRELETARKKLQLLQEKQEVGICADDQRRRSAVRSMTWGLSGTSRSRSCWRRSEGSDRRRNRR